MLDRLSNQYPEKTFYLGRVFNDTTNSYKLLWFLGLSPWFKDQTRGHKDSEKDRLIARLAQASQAGPLPTPYWLDADQVRLNPSWRHFLLENLGIVQAFAEYHLAQYLQARNPNVPGIVNKLTAPTARDLRPAHEFWQFVRDRFQQGGELQRFRDIYSDQPLTGGFTIDHFLPWSFVAHDICIETSWPHRLKSRRTRAFKPAGNSRRSSF